MNYLIYNFFKYYIFSAFKKSVGCMSSLRADCQRTRSMRHNMMTIRTTMGFKILGWRSISFHCQSVTRLVQLDTSKHDILCGMLWLIVSF